MFLKGLFDGSLISLKYEMPAASVIIPRIFNTLKLACASIVVAVAVGTVAGILSAVRRHSIVDYLSTTMALLGVSMPVFWWGLVLIMIFSVYLMWLPSGGMGGLRYLVLPRDRVGHFFCWSNSSDDAFQHDGHLKARLHNDCQVERLTLQNRDLPSCFEECLDTNSHRGWIRVWIYVGGSCAHRNRFFLARGREIDRRLNYGQGLPSSAGFSPFGSRPFCSGQFGRRRALCLLRSEDSL